MDKKLIPNQMVRSICTRLKMGLPAVQGAIFHLGVGLEITREPKVCPREVRYMGNVVLRIRCVYYTHVHEHA